MKERFKKRTMFYTRTTPHNECNHYSLQTCINKTKFKKEGREEGQPSRDSISQSWVLVEEVLVFLDLGWGHIQWTHCNLKISYVQLTHITYQTSQLSNMTHQASVVSPSVVHWELQLSPAQYRENVWNQISLAQDIIKILNVTQCFH